MASHRYLCAWCGRMRNGHPSKSVCDGDTVDNGRRRKGHECAGEMARVMRLYTLIVSRHPDLSHMSPAELFAAVAMKASSSRETAFAIKELFE